MGEHEVDKSACHCLQAEGGSYADYSQTEILQILTTTSIMPPDLARLCGKRCSLTPPPHPLVPDLIIFAWQHPTSSPRHLIAPSVWFII